MSDVIAPAPVAPAAPTLLSQAPAPVAPATTPAAWSYTKEDGTFNDGWLDKLPDDLKGNPSLKVVGSIGDLAKSFVETKKLIGTKLEAPGENATPEQLAAWRKVVGAPEKAEGYLGDGVKTLRPDTVPETLWDAEAEKGFLALAHKHHLPPAAVKEIIGLHANSIAAAVGKSAEAETASLAAEGAKLRSAFGGEYEANMALAARVAQTVGLDPKTHPIFTSAETVQIFAKFGKLLSEDKLVKGEAGGINGSIQSRLQDITDPKSSSQVAREYRGEFGQERQRIAQETLHDLMKAKAA